MNQKAVPELGSARVEGERESLLGELDSSRQKVVIREIAVESVERDPNQPRQHVDEEKLKSLADSLARDGLLQEPAVYPVQADEMGVPTHFRLIYGERRWLAARLLGWRTLRCKIVARGDQGAIDEVKLLDRQWSENAERDGLSALEEGKAIAAKVNVLQKQEPDVARGTLIERVAAERHVHPMTARNMVALVDAPESLQQAILARRVEKNLAFVLLRHWNAMRKDAASEAVNKREMRYREIVREWAAAQGIPFDAQAITKYANATAQDVKVARATCRAADKMQETLENEFAAVVAKAIEKKWTVEEATRRLNRKNGPAKLAAADDVAQPVWEEIAGKGRARLVIHLERLRPAAGASPLEKLAARLRALLAEVEHLTSAGPPAAPGEVSASENARRGEHPSLTAGEGS